MISYVWFNRKNLFYFKGIKKKLNKKVKIFLLKKEYMI
jgi:hypothetical protein